MLFHLLVPGGKPRASRLAIPPGGELGLEPAEIGGIQFRCAHDAPQHADRRKALHARLRKQHSLSRQILSNRTRNPPMRWRLL